MKKLVLLLSFLLINKAFLAQNKSEYSEPFKEPEGCTKLVQLRNGNTTLLDITKRDGIYLSLYGADRKAILSSKKLAFTKLGVKLGGPSYIPAIYDIAGDLVMFALYFGDDVSKLIRVIIDGKTGSIKEETVIQEHVSNALVEKDPSSDYYTIVCNSQSATVPNKVLYVMHFSPEHQMLNSGYIKMPNQKCNNADYLGAFVNKDQYVIIGACAYASQNGLGKNPCFFLSKLEKDNSEIIQKDLKYNKECDEAKCNFIYNKSKNNLTMILSTIVGYTNKAVNSDVMFTTIDPATLNIISSSKADLLKVNNYAKTKMNSEEEFSGFIGGTSITPDGNLIVLYQNIIKEVQINNGFVNMNMGGSATSSANNGMIYGTTRYAPVTKSFIKDLGISIVSTEGAAAYGSGINYSVLRAGNFESFGYDDNRKGKKPEFGLQDPALSKSWFYGIDIIATETANYIFCNATQENFEKPETERVDLTKAVATTNAVKYTLKNGILTKGYFLDAQPEKKHNKYCNFTSSSYNPSTKTYCTLVIDGKKNSILWIKLD